MRTNISRRKVSTLVYEKVLEKKQFVVFIKDQDRLVHPSLRVIVYANRRTR